MEAPLLLAPAPLYSLSMMRLFFDLQDGVHCLLLFPHCRLCVGMVAFASRSKCAKLRVYYSSIFREFSKLTESDVLVHG